jgi:DNA-binding NarL/FixJ family response regulator
LTGIVGRAPEYEMLREFFGTDPGAHALVLTGGPGIGKTTLWEAGIAIAAERGYRVLSARPSGAEAQLSFTALIDLLDGVSTGALAIPAPQRAALDVALLRAEPAGDPPPSHAIALGLLGALRALAGGQRLVVAIDDVQWLDAPSADALAFAMRRLAADSVVYLLARRLGRPSSVERALEGGGVQRVQVGPLSLGATRRLLSERLGLSLSRPVLRRTVDSTLGNPLFVLEVGRALVEHGMPDAGEDMPVPDGVEEMLGTRVARLSGPLRGLLLAVALSGDLRTAELAAVADNEAVEDAVEAGLLRVEGDRVRAAHPLLAAAAKRRSRARERRALHRELAGVVADEELRARHLAFAADGPDETLAATVAAAAGTASVRGARHEAVALAEQALRLTPAGAPVRAERLLTLAEYLEMAGELQRITDLLTPELPALPPGPLRARGWLLLAEGAHIETLDDYRAHLERALAESDGDPVLHAYVVAYTSSAVIGVERIAEAETQASDVLPAARADPKVERVVLYALAWARSLRGRSIDDLCARFDAISGIPAHMASPDRVAGQRLVWRGELDEARATFERLLVIADERGEARSYAFQRLHLCELMLRAGAWAEASHLLDEWAESAEAELLLQPMYERCHALLAAGRGLPDVAERWAARALARAEAIGSQWERLESLRARGVAALLAHDPAHAAASLGAVWDDTRREGVDEPGVFPVAPELVEALVALGERDQALSVTDRLRDLAERQEHPWALASAKRCGAVVRLGADAYDAEAAALLADAAADYLRLGLGFDHARSLLSLGRARRRFRKWGAARDSLEAAAAAFDALGSPGWAGESRSELARVGARRPAPSGKLTHAEQRAAEMAASGLSNKEIAQALHVTVHTVEVHLSRAYAKLGVRSRAQLASRLSDARKD